VSVKQETKGRYRGRANAPLTQAQSTGSASVVESLLTARQMATSHSSTPLPPSLFPLKFDESFHKVTRPFGPATLITSIEFIADAITRNRVDRGVGRFREHADRKTPGGRRILNQHSHVRPIR
jgi:hypothetical protein